MLARAGELLDKFVGFSEDLIKLGNHMDISKKAYEDAMNKLSEGKGNLVRRTEKLKELGVKSSKKLDQRLIDRAESE